MKFNHYLEKPKSVGEQEVEPRKNVEKKKLERSVSQTGNDGNKKPRISRRGFLKGIVGGLGVAAVETVAEPIVRDAKRAKRLAESIKDFRERGKSERGPEKREIKNIGDHFFYAYNDLRNTEGYWPNDLFDDNFIIAQKLQESGYDKKAESNKGAKGLMQTMDFTPDDLANYLNLLRYNNLLDSYKGPAVLSKKQNKEMDKLVEEKKYSNSLGKINLMKLWDNRTYVYDRDGNTVRQKGVGRKEYEVGDIRGAQEKILASYNAGPGAIMGKNREKWPGESRKYVDRIFYYMDDLAQIRDDYKEAGIEFRNKSDENYASMLMVRKMNEAAGRWKTKAWKRNRDTLKSRYLGRMKRIFEQVNKQSDNADDYYFDHGELRKMFEQKKTWD